jgi:hypothetical protein
LIGNAAAPEAAGLAEALAGVLAAGFAAAADAPADDADVAWLAAGFAAPELATDDTAGADPPQAPSITAKLKVAATDQTPNVCIFPLLKNQ